jgi:hypothetical protein
MNNRNTTSSYVGNRATNHQSTIKGGHRANTTTYQRPAPPQAKKSYVKQSKPTNVRCSPLVRC